MKLLSDNELQPVLIVLSELGMEQQEQLAYQTHPGNPQSIGPPL